MSVYTQSQQLTREKPLCLCGKNFGCFVQTFLRGVRLACMLIAFSLTTGRANAQNEDKRPPIAVLMLSPFSKNQNASQNVSLARLLSEKLCNALNNKGLQVRSFPVAIEEEAFDDPQALRKIASRSKVAWLLRGKISLLRFEVRANGLGGFGGYLFRTTVAIDVDLIDGSTGKKLKDYSGEGLRSVRVLAQNNQKPAGNEFLADDNGQPYVVNAGNQCIDGDGKKNIGLAGKIAGALPEVTWEIPGRSNVQAQLRVSVKADSRQAAAEAGVQELFKTLVPHPSEMQTFHLQKNLLPAAQKLVTVEETEKGVYAISVRIDDLQSDRPNLVREMKQLGDLQLSSIGVVAADPILQTELQGALNKAAFNVKDEQRLAALRNRAYVENMLEGKADPQALQSLKDAANGFDFILFADVSAESKQARSGVHSVLASVRVKIMNPATAEFISIADGQEFGGGSDADAPLRSAPSRAPPNLWSRSCCKTFTGT